MNKILKKNIELGIIFGLICAVLLSFSRFNAECDDLRANVLRLHIIANSDTDADQNVKLKVRDELLKNSDIIFDRCNNLEDAIISAEEKTDKICEIANEVLLKNGFKYNAVATVCDSYFETREYDGFTLPAGTYKSLTVRLGEAKGHNWWCVIFPAVCIPAAADASLADTASKASASMAENGKKYVIRFKSVEIYENLKKKFQK
ncbi:MAG: stage II sporulation protein R [Clostridia bacterium]|nr:stage II sporulation protein R [Clostridia bacterium]